MLRVSRGDARTRVTAFVAAICLAVFPITSLATGQEATVETSKSPQLDFFDGLRAWEYGERPLAVGVWLNAAKGGDYRSMRRLAELYQKGDVLPYDTALAYMWFRLAARFGDDTAADQASGLRSGLDEKSLPGIEQAIAEWKPVEPKPVSKQSEPKDASDLFAAWERRDIATFRASLDAGVSPDVTSRSGSPILFLAIASGADEFSQALLDKGAKPNARLKQGLYPLHVATAVGNVVAVKQLLAKSASACVRDDNKVYPLQIAKNKKNAEIVTLLKADMEARMASCITPCDEMASHPYDPDKPVDLAGTDIDNLKKVGTDAVEACKEASEDFPKSRRFAYQLARSFEASGSGRDALNWFNKAIQLGSPQAIVSAGIYYLDGKFIEKDNQKAIRLFEEAANLGNPWAMAWMGWAYENGEGVKTNLETAQRWYERAAKLGNSDAYLFLARVLSIKSRGEVDHDSALKYLLVAFASKREWIIDIFLDDVKNGVFNRKTLVALQLVLIKKGFLTGDADGKFGPKSRDALKAYEASLKQP
ncbi:ankyrin repeat domain-containing protein [Rhizobium sp. MHM7A]|uniref:ankyrin repeat domain-containing protein n=1 Tax=Rhizobium sp. MHM7A TaxID=2583233 RepID=UPI00110625F5|nr:ankyrin repeat domain-containing protein [Rhizobium sp. MHM7A]TLX16320.1 hypothetical protein FFR93_03040 [Rhizobium sp. MHM7A]